MYVFARFWLFNRKSSLRSSMNQNKELATTRQNPHWPNVNALVPNALLSGGECTTATCRTTARTIAPQSHRLANSLLNALVDSERALNALNNCTNTMTVKPPVRASTSEASPGIIPPGSNQTTANKLATAMTTPP